ncbi:MAG: hypothetical protein RBR87_15110 [Bacteroidales bacterium]|jgi:hypothetical protein|nr:hypothetical protein [Bacteroidales bacterium]
MLEETARKILLALGVDLEIEAISHGKLVQEILKNDSEIGVIYQQFAQDYETYLFIKQDFELKSKLNAYWEIQCKSLRQKASNSLSTLKILTEQKNIVVEGLDME